MSKYREPNSVDEEKILSELQNKYRALPWKMQADFFTRLFPQMNSTQLDFLQTRIKEELKRDFISQLYARGHYEIIHQIFSYIDDDSILASELTSSIWRDAISAASIWKLMIRRRVDGEQVWRELVIRQDLLKYFYNAVDEKANSGIAIGKSTMPTISTVPSNGIAGINNQPTGPGETMQNFSCQNGDFYRSMYNCLSNIVRHIHYNWLNGIYFHKRIRCRTETRRGIFCLQYDNKRIVCGTREGRVNFYNRDTHICERVLIGHMGSVLCLQFYEDILCTGGSDNTIRTWSMLTGDNGCILQQHTGCVFSLRLFGDVLVTGSQDHTACVWKVNSLKDVQMQHVLVGNRASVNVVDFDRKYILTAGGNRAILVWDFSTHQLRHTMQGHTRNITSLDYHDNVAISGSADLTIRVWNVELGLCTRVLKGHEKLVRCLRFNDVHIVSGSYDGKMYIWNRPDGQNEEHKSSMGCAISYKAHTDRVFRIQCDSMFAISCSLDNNIIIRDHLRGLGGSLSYLEALINKTHPLHRISITSDDASEYDKSPITNRLDATIQRLPSSSLSEDEFIADDTGMENPAPMT